MLYEPRVNTVSSFFKLRKLAAIPSAAKTLIVLEEIALPLVGRQGGGEHPRRQKKTNSFKRYNKKRITKFIFGIQLNLDSSLRSE